MKFTPKHDFKHGPKGQTWEKDNTYDSVKHGLSDEEVNYFWENGWAEVEGKDPAPTPNLNEVRLAPDNSKMGVNDNG